MSDEDDDGHDERDGERDEPDDVEDGDIVGAEGGSIYDIHTFLQDFLLLLTHSSVKSFYCLSVK